MYARSQSWSPDGEVPRRKKRKRCCSIDQTDWAIDSRCKIVAGLERGPAEHDLGPNIFTSWQEDAAGAIHSAPNNLIPPRTLSPEDIRPALAFRHHRASRWLPSPSPRRREVPARGSAHSGGGRPIADGDRPDVVPLASRQHCGLWRRRYREQPADRERPPAASRMKTV